MKKSQELPLKIRHPANEDIPFIFNSWLKSFRETGYLGQGVSNTIFYENHHKLIQKIVKRAQIFVACDERFPDQIFGYIVGERIEGILVIHYVYVKHNFRKTGIAKQLLNMFEHDTTGASCCTHLTRHVEKLLPKFNVIYHPYVILVDYEVPQDAMAQQEEDTETVEPSTVTVELVTGPRIITEIVTPKVHTTLEESQDDDDGFSL